MIEERTGDIFKQAELDVIAHQANCFCTFGAGIARFIADEYQEASAADKATKHGDREKLGTYSRALIKRGDRKFMIANVYGQYATSYKSGARATEYDAIYNGLTLLRDDLLELDADRVMNIGIPYGIASDLAGASWRVVREMIYDIFEDTDKIKVVICRLPGMRDL